MFSEQRKEKILQLLQEYNEVTVNSLTKVLSVSEATVRRDLEGLEQAGLLHRTHGGAVLIQSISNQMEQFPDEINCIGKVAAKLLENNQIIAIGPGELGLALARNIPENIECSVVTNDVLVMLELLNHPSINVIMVGGLIRKRLDSDIFASGELATGMLDELHVDKAYLSVDGVSIEKGLTLKNYEHVQIWKKLRKISDETIIMAKPDAFGKKELIKLISAVDIKCIVSNKDVGNDYKKYFFEHGIPIYLGYDL